MSFVRGAASGYVHVAAITDAVSFPACDAVICLTTGNATFTLKSGATVALTSIPALAILPFAATLVSSSTGTYAALYR
jgi:hypothetical protein